MAKAFTEAEVRELREKLPTLQDGHDKWVLSVWLATLDAHAVEIALLRKQREDEVEKVEELKRERDDAQGLLASATDLANSWARETGVFEAHDEKDIRGVIDRLWAKTSASFYEEVRRRDAALAERTRKCAEAACPYCAVHVRAGFKLETISGEVYHVTKETIMYLCKANAIRQAFPGAFTVSAERTNEEGR